MFISRVIRTSMLVAFALLVAGGPALHYAPFLGHHHHGCEQISAEAAQVSTCGCGEVHAPVPANELAFTAEHGHRHSCDGTCSICQFFSQVSLDLVAVYGVESASDVSSHTIRESIDSVVACEFSYFERGPPTA